MYALGENEAGQLGDGTRESRLEPKKVPALSRVVAIAAGEGHSLSLDEEGVVWAWGKNPFGQLGDGTRQGRVTPTRVHLP